MGRITFIFFLLLIVSTLKVSNVFSQNDSLIIEGDWYLSYNFIINNGKSLTTEFYDIELGRAIYLANASQSPVFSEEFYSFEEDSTLSHYFKITKKQYNIVRDSSRINLNNYYTWRNKFKNFYYNTKKDTLYLNFLNNEIKKLKILYLDDEVLVLSDENYYCKDEKCSHYISIYLRQGINDAFFYKQRGKYFIIPILKEFYLKEYKTSLSIKSSED